VAVLCVAPCLAAKGYSETGVLDLGTELRIQKVFERTMK